MRTIVGRGRTGCGLVPALALALSGLWGCDAGNAECPVDEGSGTLIVALNEGHDDICAGEYVIPAGKVEDGEDLWLGVEVVRATKTPDARWDLVSGAGGCTLRVWTGLGDDAVRFTRQGQPLNAHARNFQPVASADLLTWSISSDLVIDDVLVGSVQGTLMHAAVCNY